MPASESHSKAILILTNPGDFHSLVVSEALRRKNVDVREWFTSDFPTLQKSSWAIQKDLEWEIAGPELDLPDLRMGTVWLRRPSPPVLPSIIAAEDQQFAIRECRSFLNGLFHHVGEEAFWVNSLQGSSRASLKTEQLKAALRAGLRVPRTLCSNDPDRIRRFIRASPVPVIYKAFYPVSWETSEGVATLFSSIVTEHDLPETEVLQAVPGIYQEMVAKEYEIRITAMGKSLFAVRLDSQSIESAKLDWRAAQEPVPLGEIRLPDSVLRACMDVLSQLGIVFGCFDLIITPEGEAVFLEVNEMGSFLWIEERNPEIRLLDAFCEFLIRSDPDFRWTRSSSNLRLRDVKQEALRRMETEIPNLHIPKPLETVRDGI